MKEFTYVRPAAVIEAVTLRAGRPGSRYLAGGTNLVDLMKIGVEQPDELIDVTGLGMDRIETTLDAGLRIGAAVSNSDLAVHPAVRQDFAALSQAILSGASGQLRNMATVGGNLLQRTRCAYFADISLPCNKRNPGSGCPALAGEHHNHAILGWSEHCVATHPSDMVVALMAYDATVEAHTPSGPVRIPISDFYRPVADTPHLETTLPEHALITGVTVPPAPPASSRYRKVRERASFAFATGSVAAALTVRAGAVHAVRIALGGAASHPWRASTAEAALLGEPATEDSFAKAAAAELAEARPLPHNQYKVALLRDLIVAVLGDLAVEAGA
ncbi:xanthine dehydrogenase family protein subunit M [Kutzneria buriramensis]|uniref:Xanthine dehydrogenase YagS FAD-binding subunit n=1 Tax=Kutzneria buriramensis TaxID=1045776 RepID=A0A3E0G722_9PSEU|nr:xanthine dehydrogenase family protein subunit M [Kutzneria buriramensis]REH17851.1 xanthine dehydrogenase YagS FAD-binding subunit [Kutzneria buriramensis]